MMHEFTDGCSAQYKSRQCMGDFSHSVNDFRYTTILNYYERSHAKGPQDGAGANLKHMAVFTRAKGVRSFKSVFFFAKLEM